MTNEHVAKSGTKDSLEYIIFPRLILYSKKHEKSIRSYVKTRLERENSYISLGQKILQDRIAQLQQKSVLTPREEIIRRAYVRDLELLNQHRALSMSDKVFIPLDDAIEKIWMHPHGEFPDIALIILKKPIQEILKEHGSNLELSAEDFAENNLYDPNKHGWLYAGTPIYTAGYGKGLQGRALDNDKSLTVRRIESIDSPHSFSWDVGDISLDRDMWSLEREFYYFDPRTGSGSSGARLWAYLDKNGIISTQPQALDGKKVTIGIHTGSNFLFTQKDMQDSKLWQELLKYSTVLQKHGTNPFADFKYKKSSQLDYLASFKNIISPKLAQALMWHIIYKIILANRVYDTEESYLWLVVLGKLAQAFNIKEDDFLDYYFDYQKTLGELFTASERRSPSELSDEEKQAQIFNSSNMSAQQKKIFHDMINAKLFDQFGDNYEIELRYIKTPVKLKSYLDALDAWIKARKNHRQENYDLTAPVKVPDPGASFLVLEDLIKSF